MLWNIIARLTELESELLLVNNIHPIDTFTSCKLLQKLINDISDYRRGRKDWIEKPLPFEPDAQPIYDESGNITHLQQGEDIWEV
jgi:hypothetical protein